MIKDTINKIISYLSEISLKRVLGAIIISAVTILSFSNSVYAMGTGEEILPVLANNAEANKLSQCAPKNYYDEMKDCTFCPLFVVVFNAASSIAKKAIDTLSLPIKKVVVIVFGIWIALQILQFAASFEVQDLKDLVSKLIIQSFIVILVVSLLSSNLMSFFNLALKPIYVTGQTLAQTIIKPGGVDSCPSDTGVYDDSKGQGALPKTMGDSIYCTMDLIQKRVSQIKALGSACICKSWEEKVIIMPHLNYLLVGLGLWVGAMIMLLAVPFMMVDSVFQLAVAATLLPFAVGSYAFKITRGYTKKIWETFLNSVFVFIFVSLTCLMLVSAYQAVITSSVGDLSYMFEGEATDAKFVEILNKLSWFSPEFLKIVFIMILTWAVMDESKSLGGEFAGSISNTSIGSSIGTMAGSATKSFALKAGKNTAEAAWDHGSEIIKGFGREVKGVAKRGVNYAQARRAMSFGKKQDDGSYQMNGVFHKYAISQNADGSYSVDKSRKWNFRNNIEKHTLKDDVFTIKRNIKTDKNGKIEYQQDTVKYNNAIVANLFNKTGEMNTTGNTTNYDNIMKRIEQSSANEDDKKQKQIALVKAIMNQRMPHYNNAVKYVSQELIKDKDTGKFTGFKQVNFDGTTTEVRISMQEVKGKKLMITEVINIDAQGRKTVLKSNGVIHSKTTYNADGEVEKQAYSLNNHYESYRRNGRDRFIGKILADSLAGFENEVADVQKGINNKYGIHEFGTYNL
ncbi:MAG: type IV secretion system protein [Alphaproteobacteria bacterium]|nr:type IV secretion system protein [Alphaproteobacteria bacterium]